MDNTSKHIFSIITLKITAPKTLAPIDMATVLIDSQIDSTKYKVIRRMLPMPNTIYQKLKLPQNFVFLFIFVLRLYIRAGA